MGQGSLIGSNSENPCSCIVNGYLELCSKIQSQGKNCSKNWNGPAASHPLPKTFINVPGALRPQTTESWSLVTLRSLFLAFLWNMGPSHRLGNFAAVPGVFYHSQNHQAVRVICV